MRWTTLPWRGRVGEASSEARCETGWGEPFLRTDAVSQFENFIGNPLLAGISNDEIKFLTRILHFV